MAEFRIIIDHLTGSRRGRRQSFGVRDTVRFGRHPDSEVQFHAHRDIDASSRHAELSRSPDAAASDDNDETPARDDNDDETPTRHDNDETPTRHDNDETPTRHDDDETPTRHDNDETPARHDNDDSDQHTFVLRDVGSSNGTFVDGKQGTEFALQLTHSHIVEFGMGGPRIRLFIGDPNELPPPPRVSYDEAVMTSMDRVILAGIVSMIILIAVLAWVMWV